eukprot:CAMPEP_0181396754 /NCGR_PEP_ID=MMETSP1110-20121109/82_1 /TAXON_ID=174948 /ORGANISM="Symbiodinium sp., Strain CCMP421" /LENGTH=138 /DNA_ID=CAMNT_0023518471 /DNA_START=51 /DNA_END=467 /DNA_ORIENTATION=-
MVTPSELYGDTAAVLAAALMVCAARFLCNAALLQLDGQEMKLFRRQTPFKACRTRSCEGSDMDEVAWEAAMRVADLCARNSAAAREKALREAENPHFGRASFAGRPLPQEDSSQIRHCSPFRSQVSNADVLAYAEGLG